MHNLYYCIAPLSLSLTGMNVVDELSVVTLTCTVQANPAPVIAEE